MWKMKTDLESVYVCGGGWGLEGGWAGSVKEST